MIELEENALYSLIPLDMFMALMGADDRDDKTVRFCLVTASLSIEEYCKRKFLRKQYFETIPIINNYFVLSFKEYPVSEIIQVKSEKLGMRNEFVIDPIYYRAFPGNGFNEEMPFELLLSPSLKNRELAAVKVIYWAGYQIGNEKLEMRNDLVNNHSVKQQSDDNEQKHSSFLTSHSSLVVPANLSAACLELASWNFNRYKGKRIGMSGNIRGAGVQGEHFEMSMPENVRCLLEPYKRRVI